MKPSVFLPNSAFSWSNLFLSPEFRQPPVSSLTYFLPACIPQENSLPDLSILVYLLKVMGSFVFQLLDNDQNRHISQFYFIHVSSLLSGFFSLCFNYQQVQKLDSLYEYA